MLDELEIHVCSMVCQDNYLIALDKHDLISGYNRYIQCIYQVYTIHLQVRLLMVFQQRGKKVKYLFSGTGHAKHHKFTSIIFLFQRRARIYWFLRNWAQGHEQTCFRPETGSKIKYKLNYFWFFERNSGSVLKLVNRLLEMVCSKLNISFWIDILPFIEPAGLFLLKIWKVQVMCAWSAWRVFKECSGCCIQSASVIRLFSRKYYWWLWWLCDGGCQSSTASSAEMFWSNQLSKNSSNHLDKCWLLKKGQSCNGV